MRMVFAALLMVAAGVGLAGPAVAAPERPTVTPAMTGNDYNGFYVIRQNYELVYWDKPYGTYQSHLIGPGWQGTRLIAGLSTDQLLQVRDDGTLWDWKKDYTDNDRWKGYFVGGGWGDVTQITGLGPGSFMALTSGGILKQYYAPGNQLNYAQTGYWVSPGGSVKITGRGQGSFFGINGTGGAYTYAWNAPSWTSTYVGPGWGNARLLASVTPFRFVVARDDGVLVEWNQIGVFGPWQGTTIGGGWNDARLLG
ncbi:hypothetical protein GCM10010483_48300 [Actinokineospora diospyrosa]